MAAKRTVKKGDAVSYKWGKGTVAGTVAKVHKSDVEKTIAGSKVKRAASKDAPAVEIATKKGKAVLKSVSEITVK